MIRSLFMQVVYRRWGNQETAAKREQPLSANFKPEVVQQCFHFIEDINNAYTFMDVELRGM